jgi:two-component system OmpR family sensor kinase
MGGCSAWVTDLSARTPLRFKLVAALLALVTVALASSGAAAAAALNGYLQDRLDAQLLSTADEVAHGLQRGPSGGRGGPAEIEASTKLFLRVMDNEGTGLGDRATAAVSAPPVLPAIDRSTAESLAGEPFTVPSEGDGGNWRAVVVPLRGGGSVAVALSLDDVRSTVSRLVLIETVIGVLVLLALAGVAYAVVRSSLRPLREVEETAAAIAEGDLARRVPASPRGTEVGRLAAALNGMLAQIETAFHAREASEAAARASEDRMRRFVADASHELRTHSPRSAASPSSIARAPHRSPPTSRAPCGGSRTRRPAWGCSSMTCSSSLGSTSNVRSSGSRSIWLPSSRRASPRLGYSHRLGRSS